MFSVAITLLATGLPFPRIEHIKDNGALTKAFFVNWPSYLAFVLSFFSVLIMWVNHHAIFRHIQKANSHILFANGFILLLVVAVPYPTSLIAQYFNSPGSGSAAAIYAGLFILINISYNWLWYAASSDKNCLKHGVGERTIKAFRRIIWLAFLLTLLPL